MSDYLSIFRRYHERRRRRKILTATFMAFILEEFNVDRRGQYCHLNVSTPVLRLYFSGAELKTDFRLSRATVNSLVRALEGEYHHGWGKALEVGIFLYWLASATSYRVVSEAFDVPRTTVHDAVHRTAEGIMAILQRLVHLPSPAELEDIGAGFCRLAGSPAFSHVAGSIDCSHIQITPPKDFKEDFFNRKLFYSIQLQAICDHRGHFLNIFTGLPGSVHDARVLKWSSVYVQQLYPPQGWCIIGDGGYPCLASPICLMTPFREPVQNAVQARYNRHLSKARSVVERAFGMMKTRWRSIFLKALEVHSTFAPAVIACCAFLHNLCLTNNDLVEPAVDEPEDEDRYDDQPEAAAAPGDNLRHRLAAALSAPEAAIAALREHDY